MCYSSLSVGDSSRFGTRSYECRGQGKGYRNHSVNMGHPH